MNESKKIIIMGVLCAHFFVLYRIHRQVAQLRDPFYGISPPVPLLVLKHAQNSGHIFNGTNSGTYSDKYNNDLGLVSATDNVINDQIATQTETDSTNKESSLTLMNLSSSFTIVELKASSSFEWKDLNITRVVPCGVRKCFFRHASDNSIGYTLQYFAKGLDKQGFQIAAKTWKYANYLYTAYGARHFMLEPPFQRRVGKKAAQWFNSNWTNSTSTMEKYRTQLNHGRMVILQKNRVAPQTSVMFRSKGNTFRLDTKLNLEILWRLTKDQKHFLSTLQYEWNMVATMMQKEKELFYDFQIMIDDTGKIYHFDLDRVYEKYPYRHGDIEKLKDDFDKLISNLYNSATHL